MANRIKIDFKNGFNGTCRNESGSTLSIAPDQWHPYELLFTALGSCMYSTFLDIINKKKLEYEKIQIIIEGEKIDDTPAFLKTADIIFTISGADFSNEKTAAKFGKSLELSEKYCSIFNTLTKVADLKSSLVFL